MQETWVQSLGQEDPLEEGMAVHSYILAWRIPRIEEPGGLQSMGSQRVEYNGATNTLTSSKCSKMFIFLMTSALKFWTLWLGLCILCCFALISKVTHAFPLACQETSHSLISHPLKTSTQCLENNPQ